MNHVDQLQLSISPTSPECGKWHQCKRILCVRLDSLGDVLMTTPALRALKNLPSQPHLTLLTSASGAAVASMIPEVAEIWQAEVAWQKHTPMRSDSQHEVELIRRMAAGQFDACVIFTVLTQNPLPCAFLAYLANVPLRLAYSRENPYQLLTDWVKDDETIANARHEVKRQLDLVEHIGARTTELGLSLQVRPAAQEQIKLWLSDHALASASRWFVLHPGATAASRRYPVQGWAIVAQRLERTGFRCVITGSVDETNLARAIVDLCPSAIDATGEFSLEQFAALIAASPLLLCGNTGPAHMAAAVGTPVVDVYALTNPQHTPWQVAQRVLNIDVACRNCLKSQCPEGHHTCLAGVTPEQIVQASNELWLAHAKQTVSTQESSLCLL